MRPAVAPERFLAVGEPFWRTETLPDGVAAEAFVTLPETVERFEAAGVDLVGLIPASEEDWDHNYSKH